MKLTFAREMSSICVAIFRVFSGDFGQSLVLEI
jgi:hypothetical protein